MADEPRAPGLAARRAALAAIGAVEERDAYSNLAVPDAVGELPDARDRAFASHLAYDTLRWRGTIEWVLSRLLDRDLDAVEPALRRILSLGTLQLLRTDVPARAVVDTSVRLAQEAVPEGRARGAGGFVNGVLRNLSRRRDQLAWPDPTQDPVGWLALTTGHPEWIAADLLDRLGLDEARNALEADNDPPGLTLRAVGDRDALVAELRAEGIEASPGALAPEAVRAPGGDPRRLRAVAEGRAVPQDEASMVVAHATRAGPGDRALDLCAGPGGKATHLATMVGEDGEVVAVELHPHRAELVRGAARRLGLEIDVREGDGTDPPVEGEFDVVLVDAPCTGLGTGRRRPEVRWRRSPGDATTLAGLQARLLDAAALRVRAGGRVTYAACTWTEAETTGVARAFAERAGLTLEDERQLWPHRDGTDGMYHATFR